MDDIPESRPPVLFKHQLRVRDGVSTPGVCLVLGDPYPWTGYSNSLSLVMLLTQTHSVSRRRQGNSTENPFPQTIETELESR